MYYALKDSQPLILKNGQKYPAYWILKELSFWTELKIPIMHNVGYAMVI